MATQIGDLSISLKLDIRPYAESIKTALTITKQFEIQAKNIGKGMKLDTSKIDSELKQLDSTLKKYSDDTAKATTNQKGFANETDKTSGSVRKLSGSLLETGQQLTIIASGFKAVSTDGMNLVKDFIGEANKLQSANLGLESIAKFKGIDSTDATNALKNLTIVKEGLVSVSDASLSLKNLLATGFSLDQSINLIKSFGDAAAFGRQSSLTFGYAISSATEGVKNQNSILVDNAGVTKNLSLILKEAGYSEQDLQKVTTDLGVRTALYNGILKETQGQLGDTERLTKTFQGQQQKLETQVTTLKQKFGIFLQEALLPYLVKITEGDEKTQILAGSVLTLGGFLTELAPAAFFAAKGLEALGVGISTAGLAAAGYIGSFIAIAGAIGYAITQLQDYIDLKNKEAGTGFSISDGQSPFSKAGENDKDPFFSWTKKKEDVKVGMGDVKKSEQELYETQQKQTDELKKQTAEIEKQKKTKGGSSSPSGGRNIDIQKLSQLEEEKNKLVKLGEELELNKDSLQAQLDIMKQIAAVQIRIGEVNSKDSVQIKSKVAELENIKTIIESFPQDNISAFDSVINKMHERVLDSGQFQATALLFDELGSALESSLGDAWRNVFGEANSFFEQFMQTVIQRFADLAINYAISSLLNAIFPGAGIITSFFGGSSHATAGGSGGGGDSSTGNSQGLGNSIQGFMQRSFQVNNYSNSNNNMVEVPYILTPKLKGEDIELALTRRSRITNSRKA